jgi:replicative DNA helicase
MAQAQTAAHIPPQNLDAEESVLGAMMVSEGAIAPVILDVRLRDEDFYRDRHRITFGAIKALYERSEPIDALTVTELLAQRGELEGAGGKDAVSTLASTVPAAGNARHYAQIVKQNALLRRLLAAAQSIQSSVHEREGEPEELVEGAERLLFKVAHEERASDFRQVAEVLAEEIDRLEQLSKGDTELTGVPSGFRDLDSMTGGFQPGNLIVIAARPAMGKCLTGSALVYDPTSGKRRRMDEVVEAGERGEEIWVASLGPDLKLRPAKVSAVHRNGVQPVYRVTTRLGRRVVATANHPLLTLEGWRSVDELRTGDRVGVPRNLPRRGGAKHMEDHEIVLLAALIADGSLTGGTPRFCFGPNSPVLSEVERAAGALGLQVKPYAGRSSGTASITAGRGAGRNPVRELCEQHGIWEKRSEEKAVPPAIFGLSNDQLARFLGVLYACDGHIYASDRLRQIGYTTISEQLARDVQHLLLRLEIVSVVRTLRRAVYEGTNKVAREVRITGREALLEFCSGISVPGKIDKANQVLNGLPRSSRMTNTDTIPREVWPIIDAARGDRTWRELSVASQRPPTHNWHVGTRGLSRYLLAEIAEWSGSEQLHDLAESDVWWDEIASVEPAGEEETYDLTVETHHNFVADEIVVHNSSIVANIAEHVSVKHGKAVAFFSLEMSETELAHRFIAVRARIASDRLRKGKVATKDWPGVVRACNELEQAPLWIDDSSDVGMLDLRAKARRLHASEGGLGMVIVDYLQLMRPEDPRQNRVEQVAQISRGLKILARELDVPVLGISQLSRAPEQRPDKRPILSDLRESGQIEQDSDLVGFIYRDEYYNREDSDDPGVAELIVAKHRNGPTGTVRLAFLEHYPSFANLSRQEKPVEQSAGEGPPIVGAAEGGEAG